MENDELYEKIENIRLLTHYVNRNKPNINREIDKKRGAPFGHKGYTRKNPDKANCIKTLEPINCTRCKIGVLSNTQEVRSRWVTDININLKAKITKFEIHRKYCRICKRIMESQIANVIPHARFGFNIMVLATYMRLGLRITGSKICDYFSAIYNIKMSTTTPLLFQEI